MEKSTEKSTTERDGHHFTGIFIADPRRGKPGWPFLVLGVLFPFLVVILEFTTRMCAEEFFDPIPTAWHTLMVSFVPFSNLLVWYAARQPVSQRVRLVAIANGTAIGVASYYTLLFAPLLPLALVALFVGLGFLPMAPLFSLAAGIKGHSYLRNMASRTEIRLTKHALGGLVIGVFAIIAMDLPVTVTRIGMEMASSADAQSRARGIRLLRLAGDEDVMLRFCYQRRGKAIDLVSLLVSQGRPISPEKAREVYHRVTGTPFNSVPPAEHPLRSTNLFGRFTWDPELGSTHVGGRMEGLSLISSRIDGSVDPDAALAYVEWTMEFKNDSVARQEARAQIGLPPGGVVSRLTLWIDGEEREAAFAARSQARLAYDKVVKRRRDPVLVTTSGPDQALVQCFPVEPNGGTMRTRIGITLPLVMLALDDAFMRLPHFLERNFQIPEEIRHQVWVESSRQLTFSEGAFAQERAKQNQCAVRGALTDEQLLDSSSVIRAARSREVAQAWSQDSASNGGEIVLQVIEKQNESAPESIVLIIDGSSGMARFVSQIAGAVRSLPEGIRLVVVVASDDPAQLYGSERWDPGKYDRIADGLSAHHFVGGQDNVPALAYAWDIATQRSDSVVVWIHGPQPVQLSSPGTLSQRWERRPGNPLLYEIQAIPGPNRITEALDGIPYVHRVPRLGTVEQDLRRLFTGWKSNAHRLALKRLRFGPETTFDRDSAKKSSDHLVRLWASDEVLRLRSIRTSDAQTEAVNVAARYHLVTPVTGAVVLETAQQYREAGLTPVPPEKVPTIPEPETWLLMAVILIVFLWVLLKRRVPCLGE